MKVWEKGINPEMNGKIRKLYDVSISTEAEEKDDAENM